MPSVDPKSTPHAIALKQIVRTTHAGRDALKHVLEVGLEMEAHEPLAQALLYQGVFDINAILRMSSDDVKGLHYKDCQGNETHLGMGTRNEIRDIQQYNYYHIEKGFPIGDHWKSLTAQEFRVFQYDLAVRRDLDYITRMTLEVKGNDPPVIPKLTAKPTTGVKEFVRLSDRKTESELAVELPTGVEESIRLPGTKTESWWAV
jgi:hypothetical protein